MSKVLHLTRRKDQSLAERGELSDEEDSEDKEIDVEDVTIPVKSNRRKMISDDKKAKKPRLRIRKEVDRKRRAQEPPGGDHNMSRKRRK